MNKRKKRQSLRQRRWANVKADLKHNKLASVAIVLLLAIIVICVLAPVVKLDPTTMDPLNMAKGPSKAHWFGTDELGRDYLARVVYGGRVSLTVGILAMLASAIIGITVGTVAGYCGGIVDSILMRFVDILASIPWLIRVTVASLFLKRGVNTIILVIGLFTWMSTARLVRAETLSLKEREYVMYARFAGMPFWKVILTHIIPAAFPTIIVVATTSIADAIMTESALSFLGIGIVPPASSWGSLLQKSQGFLQNSIHMAIVPGVLIVIVVYAFNSLGNLLRTYIEPGSRN